MEFSLPVKTVKTQSNFGIIFDPVQIRLVAGKNSSSVERKNVVFLNKGGCLIVIITSELIFLSTFSI